MKYLAFTLTLVLTAGLSFSVSGQYKSLLWKVSGNGLKKPSYLYGTMHISGKLAFQLGDPFYDCIESSDVVALELEPEAWLNSLFNDDQVLSWMTAEESDGDYYDEFAYDSPLPVLRGHWTLGNGLSSYERVKAALLYEPDLLNYLMFRYGEGSSSRDFEEDTWLDMHIYQVAKKLGRETMGLETYEQSDQFIRKANAAEAKSIDQREWDEGDINDYEELNRQLEPAYRRQDLDLIDSLSRNTASDAFRTYILLERNKLFVNNIDSLLRIGKSVFAAMGCAHLPGQGGVIEELRALGYEVEPISKGSRNAKRRKEIDQRIHDRQWERFYTPDQSISLEVPAKMYHAKSSKESSTWLSLDIANGASYTLTRLKAYHEITGYSSSDLLAIIDSMFYETVAGEIISKKSIKEGRYPGIEVINKTRSGNYERQRVVVTPDEIVVLKLSATGEKVKLGYGSPFFERVQLSESSSNSTAWQSADGSVKLQFPSHPICYENSAGLNPDFEVVSSDATSNTYYIAQRHVIETPGFLDEDTYELQRFMRAFAEDRNLKPVDFKYSHHGKLIALEAELIGVKGQSATPNERVFAVFVAYANSYIALSTNDSDEPRRRAWLGSLELVNPVSNSDFKYENSELFFSVRLPYLPPRLETSSDGMLFNPDLELEPDTPFGTNATTVLSPPNFTDAIHVEFQRYHEFSDGEDKDSYLRDKRELTLGIDMKLLSQKVNWNESGGDFQFVVGDTATSRRFMHRMLLHNKSYYHLSTCYDSIIGLPDWIKTAFESFRSTDTVFPFPHFEIRDNAYLDALTSADSLLRLRALSITSEMDFSASSAPRMRALLKELPNFHGEDARLIKTKLVSGLAADTSAANIDFIEREFNAYPDSAQYQYELLSVLLRMKTARAWRAYARLVVEEPPIVFDELSGSGCEALFDSVALAIPLLPQLIQLLAIDEYEESIYHLMAIAADSGKFPVSAYRFLVPQILVEARNELKRLKSSSESGYAFNTDVLIDYCTLLHPIRKEKDVAAFFKKAFATTKSELLMDLVAFDIEHGVAVSDSIINRLARMKDQVHTLYSVLYDNALANRMPLPYKSREALAGLYLENRYSSPDERNDSIVRVANRTAVIRGTTIDLNFYKIFKTSSGQWLGHVLAFDARDPSNAWPLFIESDRSVVIDDDEDAIAELESEFLYMEELYREYVNFGSGNMDFSVHWY
jgi:uncharacterized protein YbaP (TraB family)